LKELFVSLDEVKDNFRKYNHLDDQVMFLKGWFKDTLSSPLISKLSLLRLDGDMYESTIEAMFYLYPKLSVGGFCIVDDWGAIPACRNAIEDYRRVFGIDESIQLIDWTGICWKKEKGVAQMSRSLFNKKLTSTK
jgi:O-methyltransferase